MRSLRIPLPLPLLLLLATLFVVARPESLAGQQLRGVVRLADGMTPAAGSIIEAVLVTDSLVRARALAGSEGNFLLRLPAAGRYRVAGLRIGFLPTALGVHELGAGETKQVEFHLYGVMASLDAVQVDADAVCSAADGGSAVATLLAQARLALQSTLLSSPDGRTSATWRLERVITDRHGVALSDRALSTRTSATDRPFRSVPVARLANAGYVQVGDGGEMQFSAPDAEALLSEQFVSSHCYRVAASGARPAEVGVSFFPAGERRDGFVDIAGTLWLDRASAELRRLEFNFVGLGRELDDAGASGLVEFKRLDSGVWFVSRWWLRMPRATVEGGEMGRYTVVRAVDLTGGEVEVVQRGDATLHQSNRPGEATMLPIQTDSTVAPSCAVGTEDLRETPGLVYGMALDARQRPLASGNVVASWLMPANSKLGTGSEKQDQQVTVQDGFFMICNLPLSRLVQVYAVSGTQVSPVHLVRLRRETTHEAIRLVIEGDK